MHTTRFDQSLYHQPAERKSQPGRTHIISSLIAGMLIASAGWYAYERQHEVFQCSDTIERRLVSEYRYGDSVECVYIKDAPRTVREKKK